uniref:Uncharacterized protein n=1 Tax=Anopheles funestus TaxID=62324 RepID=A0A182S0S8_ANOFN
MLRLHLFSPLDMMSMPCAFCCSLYSFLSSVLSSATKASECRPVFSFAKVL